MTLVLSARPRLQSIGHHLGRAWRHLCERPMLLALVLAVGVRLVWLALTQIGVAFQPPGRFVGALHGPLIDPWLRWDAAYFVDLTRYGYPSDPTSGRIAFFPLYPLVARGICDATGLDPIYGALLVSNVADVLGWLAVAGIATARYDKRTAVRILIAFALFPTRNFGMAAYSEGLFLLLSAGAFCLYEGRRYAWAGIACALASAARPQGVLVGASLVGEVALLGGLALLAARRHRATPLWREDPVHFRAAPDSRAAGAPLPSYASHLSKAWLLLFPAGLVCHMVFLQQRFGDPLQFIRIQAGWKRSLTFPWNAFLAGFDPFEFVVTVAALALVYLMVRRRAPLRDLLYAASSLLVPLSTGRLMSMPRFVGLVFPLFFAATLATKPRSLWERLYVATGIALSIYFALKVGRGGKIV